MYAKQLDLPVSEFPSVAAWLSRWSTAAATTIVHRASCAIDGCLYIITS
jgi:hypothetical protein